MSRCLAVLRLLAMGSLGLWAPGCASMYVSSMLPRVDGSAELRLYTASPTLELHKNGGRIAIDSQPGMGTAFELTLPLRASAP